MDQEGGLQAARSLEDHIVHVLGAETLDRWTVEVGLSTQQIPFCIATKVVLNGWSSSRLNHLPSYARAIRAMYDVVSSMSVVVHLFAPPPPLPPVVGLLAARIQMTYKMKQKKKKTVGSEMRFGVNTTAPFVGMKREEGAEYPFAKQVMSKNGTYSKYASKKIPLSLPTAVRYGCGNALLQ